MANIAIQPNRVSSIRQTPKNKPCFLYKAILVRLFKKLWLKCYTIWFLVCLNKSACCITIWGLEGFRDVMQLLICGYPRETPWGSVVLDRYPLEPAFQDSHISVWVSAVIQPTGIIPLKELFHRFYTFHSDLACVCAKDKNIGLGGRHREKSNFVTKAIC